MVSSRRKMAARESNCSKASLIGGSGYRWSLHEGEWARSFGLAQWRKRRVMRRCSSVNQGGGREQGRGGGLGVKEVKRRELSALGVPL
jgi:hypothetical protein